MDEQTKATLISKIRLMISDPVDATRNSHFSDEQIWDQIEAGYDAETDDYDLFLAAALLLEIWAASLACAYDIVVEGQSLHRSQLLQAKLTLAQTYRRQARPRRATLVRSDMEGS